MQDRLHAGRLGSHLNRRRATRWLADLDVERAH